MVQRYEQDFARFLEQGRIGSELPAIGITLDRQWLHPGAWVRGQVRVEGCALRDLGWRMQGERAWQPVDVSRTGVFSLRAPQRAGRLELLARGVIRDLDEMVEAAAQLGLAWPRPGIEVRLSAEQVERHCGLSARVRCAWVRRLRMESAGVRLIERELPHGAPAFALEVPLPTQRTGACRARIEWEGFNGELGTRELDWQVLPRSIVFEQWPLASGGLRYRVRNAEALELVLPDYGIRHPLPLEGVVEHRFVGPVGCRLRYRDEAGQRCERALVLDFAPRRWSELHGFAAGWAQAGWRV